MLKFGLQVKLVKHFKFQKIVNFLDTTSVDKGLPRFATKKWVEVYDQSEGNYNFNKEIRIKKSTLSSDLCDYSDAYIVVKGNITVKGAGVANKQNKVVAFKHNAPFTNCVSKINGVKTDNAEDLDVVICLSIVKIIKKQQVICGIIIEMN